VRAWRGPFGAERWFAGILRHGDRFGKRRARGGAGRYERCALAPAQLPVCRALGLVPCTSTLQSLTPAIWTWLRGTYIIEQQLADGHEGFQVLRWDPDARTIP
jgi:hypothetical protein